LIGVTHTGDVDLKRDYLADRYLTDGNPLRDLPALTTYQRRGSLQLWQFLIALLENPANTSFIAWTGRGLEFKLIEPEEVSNTNLQLICDLKQHKSYFYAITLTKFSSVVRIQVRQNQSTED